MSDQKAVEKYQPRRRPALGRSWHANELTPDVTRRLSRSATIALLLSPVGILIVSAIRLLIIANYNTTTALAIAASGGYINTLFGTVIPLIPILLPYIALALLFSSRVILASLTLLAVTFVSPTAVSRPAVVQFITRSWHAVIHNHWSAGLLTVACIAGLLLLVEFAGLGYSFFFKTLAPIVCIALLPVVLLLYPFPVHNTFYAELIRQPWLPPETITLGSGQVFTGYILSEDQDWVVVLGASSRTIYYYHADEVKRRQICQMGRTSSTKPLISLQPSSQGQTRQIRPCETGSPAFS